MASHSDASLLRDAVCDAVEELADMRPRVVGVMPLGHGEFAIKVTLPRSPDRTLPNELLGIPVRYDIAVSAPVLTGETQMSWYKRLRGRRE